MASFRIACSILFLALACSIASAQDEHTTWPSPDWLEAEPEAVSMDAALLDSAQAYAETGGGSGMIVRRGRVVRRWGDQAQRYDLKSTSKSIGVTALGLALADGKMQLSDPVRRHHPTFGTPPDANAATGWLDDVTLLHLATQTAGFEKPGGYEPLTFEPGTMWRYSDAGPNWLAEALTLAYGRDVEDLLFERVFTPIGITRDDLRWRDHQYRPHEIAGVPRREFGSGVHANVDAMARIGLLYLHDGRWRDDRLIPAGFVAEARTTPPWLADVPVHPDDPHDGASAHYGLLWWNNGDGTLEDVPRDAFWSWGLYDSIILVVPSLDLVAARAGAPRRQWARTENGAHYDVLRPFFGPIVASVRREAPVPPSPVVAGVEWDPAEDILRLADGSDNWPSTWADDDRLYTAYGDGWGFDPKVPEKLSLGLARVEGSPPDLRGENLRAPTLDQIGQGAAGKKASGMLMVEGVLYLWVRNAGNAQLAWSADRGGTWTWADWRFTTSFGAPTFLNFGPNYAGARDDFVYIYSHDAVSAYDPADRMVLARVPKDRILDRAAYTFFERFDDDGTPVWTPDIAARGAVFAHPGRAYRSGVSYNAGLGRYLWCHPVPGGDTRFEGGFGIYDAPEPWGPWTTVYFTELWDVGPGETCSLPPKWMSDDGRTAHLLFSGDDAFSVRRVRFSMRD